MLAAGIDPGATSGIVLLDVRGARAWWLADESTRDPFASDLLREPSLDVVCIETPTVMLARDRFSPWMATNVANAKAQARELRRHFLDRGIAVLEVTAGQWRGRLIGKASADDALIAMMIPRLILDWPARSNAHVRDAAGVALWGARTAAMRLSLGLPTGDVPDPAPRRGKSRTGVRPSRFGSHRTGRGRRAHDAAPALLPGVR